MLQEIDIKEGLSFDSSLFDSIDRSISFDEYRDTLITLLQPILERRFSGNYQKQKILKYVDRLNFCCPVCGDSAHSNFKKRGNFILAGKFKNYFKCHNCNEFKRIDQFFKDFRVELNLGVINYISNNLVDFSHEQNQKYDLSIFLDVDNIERYAIDREDLKRCFGLVEVKESQIYGYLIDRLQYKSNKFLYNPKKDYLLVLNLTKTGRVLGTQRRMFKGDNKYLTYKLSKLYELMGNSGVVPEEIDSLSEIFNICLIGFNKSVTCFEGPLDSFLFSNAISNTGANKSIPFDIELKFFFDDDITGRKHTFEEINKGNSVFLWGKIKKEYGLPPRKKFDLNDLMIWMKQNNINVPNLDHYFSDDPLDAIDI
jgi:hypothetical protein